MQPDLAATWIPKITTRAYDPRNVPVTLELGGKTPPVMGPVFYQGPFSAIQMLFQPLYANRALKLINQLIKLKG